MRLGFVAALAAFALAAPLAATAATPAKSKASADRAMLERGRYLLDLGGCNDCHTSRFAERGGDVPTKDWLLGEPALGFSGPWGTTYATNLRNSMAKMTEGEWVKYAKTLKARPPMPWFNLRRWKDGDLRALYRYTRSLGPTGEPVTKYLPPGQTPPQPFIHWSVPVK